MFQLGEELTVILTVSRDNVSK